MCHPLNKKSKCALNKEILDSHNKESIFLEHAVVELVYKFDEKPTTSVSKGELTSKMPLTFWGHIA